MLILLVEDNPLNRDMLERRLQRRGFTVAIAEDGVAGVEMATRLLPALILMDLSLPGLSGLDATRRLKADPRTAHIPIIAVTAHAMTADRTAALAAGCDDFDTKPIDFRRLLERIERLLPPTGAD